MGKRKRRNNSEHTEDPHRKQKRPRSSNYHAESSAAALTHRQTTDASGLSATTAVPIKEAVARAIRILEPPSGLNRSQRRRWRLLTRTAAASVTASNTDPPSHTAAQTNEAQGTPAASVETKAPVDLSFLKQFSVTQLVPKPQKRWHDYRKQQDSTKRQTSPRQSSPKLEMPTDETLADGSKPSTPERSKKQPEPILEHSRVESFDASPRNVPPKYEHVYYITETPNERRIPASSLTSFLTRDVPVSMNFRRSSFGKKPTSIPSYSENTDVASSFKRFTAFLRGRDAESSDDESEESEEESDGDISDRTDRLPPPKDAHGRELKSPDNDPASSVDRKEHPDHLSTAKPDPSVLNAASQAIEDDAPLPKFRQNGSGPVPTIPFSRQANIGVKRQLSFLGQDHGGTLSGSGGIGEQENVATKEPNRLPHLPIAFDESDDDSEHMLQTIDEISRNVFAATRPLPASKPPVSPDPEHEDREDGLMTSASSDRRRVTRSMSTPKSTPKRNKLSEVLILQRTAIACNSAHVPEFQDTQSQTKMADRTPASDSSDNALDNINIETNALARETSTSSLSELSRSPSPPPTTDARVSESGPENQNDQPNDDADGLAEPEQEAIPIPPKKKKRKMTGRTSKHFTPEKRRSKRSSVKTPSELKNEVKAEKTALETSEALDHAESEPTLEAPPVSHSTRSSTAQIRKGTGKKSSYFTPSKPPLDLNIIDRVDRYNSTGKKNKRVPSGTSTAPVPSTTSARFGIIQEKLWQEPFWLLIAVTFLNKTTGRAAVPIFWELKKRYVTPEALAEAKLEDLYDLIYHLGLQRQRSKRIIAIARAWVENPPMKGRRWRTLHYPLPGDGKEFKASEVVEEDADDCAGALEIGHIPGCGPYAWDSWRIFCRDVLRGVAGDYNRKSVVGEEEFVPEWRKVLPLDKELRACLRWMWLRDGWIWDHGIGQKRSATGEEMEMAVRGEMEIEDEQERKFAALAAGVEVVEEGEMEAKDEVESPTALESRFKEPESMEKLREKTPEPQWQSEDSASDNIIVSSATRAVRRSARLTA